MEYLPLFDGRAARLDGGAEAHEKSWMLFGRGLSLEGPRGGVSFRARGRQLGIVFFRHAWSGVVEIRAGDLVQRHDLYAPESMNWVVELPLASSSREVPVSVRALGERHPSSAGAQVWIQGAYVSDHLTSEIPELLAERVEPCPYDGAQLNQLTDVFKWYDPAWLEAMRTLGCSPPYVPPDFIHRKAWEWTQCLYGLDCLGALREDARALGVGVGVEPLSFFLSNHVGDVVATDLYPEEGQWSEHGSGEGNRNVLRDADHFAPFPYRRDRLRFLSMDGKHLDFAEGSFDLVWSVSSIEHFGGHAGSAESLREIERVLRPGGVACIITEYVLPDPVTGCHGLFDAEYFNLRCLYDFLIAPAPSLRLVQRLDLSIPDYYVRRACRLPEEARAPHEGSSKPHVVLRAPSGALFTSVALFLRKEGGGAPASGRRLWAQDATR